MILTGARPRAAAAGRRHRRWPSSTWRWRSACSASRRPATAASPARATARAAASTARRPTSCPATGGSTNAADRAHVAAVWGVDPDDAARAGRRAPTSCSTRSAPRAASARCWCFGSNVAVSSPERAPRRGAAARRSTSSSSATSSSPRPPPLADVVLPVTQWAEEERHDDQPRGARDPAPQRRRAAARACAPTSRSSRALAERLGEGARFLPTEPEEVFDELRRASAGGRADYAASPTSGSPRARASSGPAPPRTTPARRACSPSASPRPTAGRASSPCATAAAAELPDADYPYLSPPAASRAHYQSGTQTRRSPALAAAAPRPYVELHPELARVHGIAERRPGARCRTPRGEAVLTPRLDPDSPPRHGVRAVPLGRRGGANALTNPALDPTSRMPEFKVCAGGAGEGRPGDERRRGPPTHVREATPPGGSSVRRCRQNLKPTTRRHRCTARPASCRGSSRSRARGWTSPLPCTRR